MSYEVERKFRVDDRAELEARLADKGAEFSDAIRQVDGYFNHPSRDFAETDEALRIRSVGESNCVTYKGPRIDTTTKTRREIELPLADGQPGADDFAELLVALGFRPVLEVAKTRTPGRLPFDGTHVTVALDHVEALGDFCELEIVAEEADVDEAKARLAALAAELKLDRDERRSYLEMALEQSTD